MAKPFHVTNFWTCIRGIWIFFHSYSTASCSSRTFFGAGFLALIACFKVIQRFSIGLRCGLCAGHSMHSRLFLFQDVTRLARCTGALSSCNIVSLLRCRLLATNGNKCFCKVCLYFFPMTSTFYNGERTNSIIRHAASYHNWHPSSFQQTKGATKEPNLQLISTTQILVHHFRWF